MPFVRLTPLAVAALLVAACSSGASSAPSASSSSAPTSSEGAAGTRIEVTLSDALRQRVSEIDYVDLRFDGRVYVRPLGQPGKGGVARAALPTVSRPDDADQH